MFNLPSETEEFLTTTPIKRFHLGCGTVFLKDWINIGYWGHLEPGRLYANPNATDGTILLNYDLTNGIPAAANSLDAVYHSHMLEHLTYEQGIEFLRQIHIAMRPDALHRLLVPDLGIFIREYNDEKSLFLEKYKNEALTENPEIYQTNGSILIGMLYNHGHKCSYDHKTITWALNSLGFKNITKTLFQESSLPDIKEIEKYSPVRGYESLCVECTK